VEPAELVGELGLPVIRQQHRLNIRQPVWIVYVWSVCSALNEWNVYNEEIYKTNGYLKGSYIDFV